MVRDFHDDTPIPAGQDYGYMSRKDRRILAHVLQSGHRPTCPEHDSYSNPCHCTIDWPPEVHPQGVSIPPNEREGWVLAAEGGLLCRDKTPSVEIYWQERAKL